MTQDETRQEGQCLHLLFSHGAGAAKACIQQLQEGDTLVLLNTAVLLLLQPGWRQELPQAIQLCVVEADLQAQGLTGIPATAGTRLIDEAGWVELVIRHPHCLSWK